MSEDVAAFYDDLAAGYHLIVDDWEAWGRWQGDVLDKLIDTELGSDRRTLLDCSCGIGTQALALAERGYTVHALTSVQRQLHGQSRKPNVRAFR